jgi:CubicO group peptidase (beta-lactamase class C family)
MSRASILLAFVLSSPAWGQPPPYGDAIRHLERVIERERVDAGIPGLSVAVVDGDSVVWARGFGHADLARTRLADADTVYRVGSVSKLFTDVAVMQLVEEGKLDLDAPVTRYLPDFRPANPPGKAITLRQLMAHRSGLVREPPVGNYFDPDQPSLEKTVASLNGVPLVY